MAIFGPKPSVNPFRKMSIFRLFELVVFIIKDIFLAYIAKKKKIEKMAIIGPKPWVDPFEKMSIFRLFELFVFIAKKGVFLLQKIVKDIFLAYIG